MSLAGSWWGGHISLMGAYDAATDSALILDVWKYADPFWVKIDKVCMPMGKSLIILSVGSGENGLLFPCFTVYFSKVRQNLLNPAGGALTSTPIFVTKWNCFYPKVE